MKESSRKLPVSAKAARLSPRRRIGAAAVIEESTAMFSDERLAPIVGRPDGVYWIAPDGRQEFGPFESVELARADRDRYDERAPEPAETLQEAEADIGIADWIDPETGAPAEGHSPPHLDPQ
jgi:hypothetical protein